MFLKKVLYIIAVFTCSVFFIDVFALNSSSKWKILESFKDLEYEMIFESNDVILTKEDKGLLNTSNKMNVYSNIWSKIKTKREYLQEQNLKITSRVESLEENVKFLDEEIKETIKDVKNFNDDVIIVKKQIDKSRDTIVSLKEKVNENKEVLLDYVNHLYKKSLSIYKNGEIDNIKAIILSWENIWDIINDIHFKSIIQVTGKQILNQYRTNIYELYVQSVELESQELELKKLRKNLMIKNKVLKDKKDFKERLLELTKWKESLYKKYIKEKLELEKTVKLKEFKEKIKFNNARNGLLKKYWCTFIDLSKNTLETRYLKWKCLEINKIIYAESRIKTLEKDWNNVFSWPINNINGISAYFHDKGYREDFWSEHDAIDIVTPQWSYIYAPADWYVVYQQAPVSENYAYVAIKHSGEFITTYGHINETFVKQYDFVKKWQKIAKTWWAYGTKWAWLLTTWPHLHFWVFKNKEYVDPLNYMDISHFSFDGLQDKYVAKYISDFKNKYWYEYKVRTKQKWFFKLEWETEVERQKSLLNQYAVWPFKNWNVWVEEAVAGDIDPTFMMCVGLAESWLWNHLKTAYNVWNVWNTDSWWTYVFKNARQWIYWMVRTFNNRILWKYNHIKDLSRYWNKKWPIYASSPSNWHNNIIKCMSHIKWEYVEDDYNFRLKN